MRAFTGKTIWLVGASEGIGEQLAHQLALHGARLIVSARNIKKLEGLLPRLEGEGHAAVALDVTREESVQAAWKKITQKRMVPDIFIYNAGVYEPQSVTEFNYQKMESIVQVNLLGAMRVLEKLLPAFIKRKAGHVVLVASVSGYSGLPNSLAYGTSKAGLIHLAECLKSDLAPHGIKVQMVNPGFVKTRLTEKNDFPMPFLITPQQAASAIVRGMRGCRFDIHFPKAFTLGLKFLRLLPYWLYFRIVSRITK